MFTTACDEGFCDMLPGVRRKTLSYGDATMLTEFRLRDGAVLPVHDHPHEQTGYLVAGRLRLTVEEETRDLAPGDSWSIPGGASHGAVALADTVVVEVFSPIREDFLSGSGA